MTIYEQPNLTGNGIDEVLVGITTSVPIFTPMALFFIFAVVFITGVRKQKMTTGFGDAPLWATIAGIVTSMVALLLSLKSGLIQLETLVITITITIASGIWLFTSKDRV